jgi:DNA primase
MDAIAAHQHGHRNVVAAMGTALTEAQITLVKRFTKRIVLALDADAAGQMATLRGLETMQSALGDEVAPVPDALGIVRFERKLNADIAIVQLPEGKDPDELIRKDTSAWPRIVETARPFMAFYIDAVVAEVDEQDPRAKSAAIARVAPLIRQLPDRVLQAHYIEALASRLRLERRLVESEVRRSGAPSARPRPASGSAEPEPPPQVVRMRAEDHLIALLLANRSLLDDVVRQVTPRELTHSRNQSLLATLLDPEVAKLEPEQIVAGLDDPLADYAEWLLSQLEAKPALLPGAVRKEAVWALYRVRLERLKFLQREVSADIREAQATGDDDTESSFRLRLNELAANEKALYPPPSPYFPDTRTADSVRPSRVNGVR